MTSEIVPMREVKLEDLKAKSPTELLAFAEEVEVENASTLRKQELMFTILKQLAASETEMCCEKYSSIASVMVHYATVSTYSAADAVLRESSAI